MEKKVKKDYYFQVEHPKDSFFHVEARGYTKEECRGRLLFANFEPLAERKSFWWDADSKTKRDYLEHRFGKRVKDSTKDKFNEYIQTEADY